MKAISENCPKLKRLHFWYYKGTFFDWCRPECPDIQEVQCVIDMWMPKLRDVLWETVAIGNQGNCMYCRPKYCPIFDYKNV